MSLLPPGGNGTTSLIGFVGFSAAAAMFVKTTNPRKKAISIPRTLHNVTLFVDILSSSKLWNDDSE